MIDKSLVEVIFTIPKDAMPLMVTLDYATKDDFGCKEVFKFDKTEKGYKNVEGLHDLFN